jgi:hypothetical protein
LFSIDLTEEELRKANVKHSSAKSQTKYHNIVLIIMEIQAEATVVGESEKNAAAYLL